MARWSTSTTGRGALIERAHHAAWIDHCRHRLDVGDGSPSPATLAALEPLTEEERRFVLALADGTSTERGSLPEIIARHYGPYTTLVDDDDSPLPLRAVSKIHG